MLPVDAMERGWAWMAFADRPVLLCTALFA
jgi:hypothetical protein